MELYREGAAINKATSSSFDPVREAYCEKHREYGEKPLSTTVKPSIHQIVASCNSLWVCWIYRPARKGNTESITIRNWECLYYDSSLDIPSNIA